MEPSLEHAGLPAGADKHSHIPNTDSVANNNNLAHLRANAILAYPHHFPATNGHGQFVPSLGLSPPQEPAYYQPQPQAAAPSSWGKHLGSPISFPAELNHPPTPPNDDFNPLRQWQAQEHAKAGSNSTHPPSHPAPAKGSIPTAEQQRYAGLHRLLPPPYLNSYGPAAYAPSYTAYQAPWYTQSQRALQNANAFFDHGYHYPYQHNLESTHPSNGQSYARLAGSQTQLPATADFLQPHHIPSAYNISSGPAPTVQRWPTANLSENGTKKFTSPQKTTNLFDDSLTTGPSPGHDGKSRVDKRIRDKQEAFRQKAAATKRQRQSIAAPGASAARPRKPSNSTPTKRKRTSQPGDFDIPTMPPPLRHTPVPGYHPSYTSQDPQFDALPTKGQSRGGLEQHVYQPNMPDVTYAHSQKPRLPSPPPPVDWDAIDQPLGEKYKDYNWPVTLYEIDRNGQFEFAQSWFEQLFELNLKSDEYKWHTHTTTGHIKDGDRFSLLVLHNAANPLDPPPNSTTSIGVYGRHWHEHNAIHWVTIAPDIRWLINHCEDQKGISVKRKWHCTMPKAADKRFHRAYWLAARMMHLGGLLNHGELNDKPHDEVEEDPQDDFELTEEDLTNAWPVTTEDAEKAWRKILDDNEDHVNIPKEGYEHVVTGCSEGVNI